MTATESTAEREPGYRVELLRSVEQLPLDLWEQLAPADDPMWSRGVFTALERSRVGPDGYSYLTIRQGDVLAAVLPLCLFRELWLDRVVGPRERRLLAPLRRLAPGLLRVPMLFCGNLLGQGHVLAPGALGEEASRLLVAAVLDFARRERLGTVVFKDFAPADLDPLRTALQDADFFFLPSLPDTELPLESGSFEDYLAALPAKPRRNARSKIRKFEARSELRIEVLDDFQHLLPQLLALYRQVMDRADQTLDLLDASFLAAVQGGVDLRRRLVVCFEGSGRSPSCSASSRARGRPAPGSAWTTASHTRPGSTTTCTTRRSGSRWPPAAGASGSPRPRTSPSSNSAASWSSSGTR